jgi:flagellar biosynthesis protein FliR
MDASALLNEIRQQLGVQLDFTQVLLGFALLMARVLPVLLLTPFLGGETVPSEVKIGLGVMLGLVLSPLVFGQVRNVPVTAILFVALMLKELFVGLAISMVVAMVFDAANMAGGLIDIMSGTNQAQLMVPQIGSQVSLFANLKVQLVTVLFLTLDGHHVVIQTIADSLSVLPLDQYPRFGNGSWAFFETMLRISGDIFRVALALSSPVLLAAFLTDLALGMINRVAPQVQVFFIAMQIKPAVTVLIMVSSMHLILSRVVGEYSVMFRWLRSLIALLG